MTQDESAADEEVQDHEYLRSLQNPVTGMYEIQDPEI